MKYEKCPEYTHFIDNRLWSHAHINWIMGKNEKRTVLHNIITYEGEIDFVIMGGLP